MKLKTIVTSIAGLFLIYLAACSSEKDTVPIPAGILTPEQMRPILTDFALAESAAVLNIYNLPLNKMDSAYAFDPLADNNVRKSQFDSSLSFYSEHPKLYKQIYDSVLVSLSQMKSVKGAKAPGVNSK